MKFGWEKNHINTDYINDIWKNNKNFITITDGSCVSCINFLLHIIPIFGIFSFFPKLDYNTSLKAHFHYDIIPIFLFPTHIASFDNLVNVTRFSNSFPHRKLVVILSTSSFTPSFSFVFTISTHYNRIPNKIKFLVFDLCSILKFCSIFSSVVLSCLHVCSLLCVFGSYSFW